MSWQRMSLIVGVILGLISLVGVGIKVDSFYAHAAEIEELATKIEYTNKRLESKIHNDSVNQQLGLKWKLEDRLYQLDGLPKPLTAGQEESRRITASYLHEVEQTLRSLEEKSNQP